jgi:hypothetical protein
LLKKFEYLYDDEIGILYKYYFGEIVLEDISSSWNYAIEQNLIPKGTRRFVVNYKLATFNIRISEYPEIANYFKKNLEVFGGCRIAVVTNINKDFVFPLMVKKLDEGYESSPFAELDDAVNWVMEV